MIKVDAITKRDFPTMARVLFDLELVFGVTERRCLVEGGKKYGEPSSGEYVQPVLEQQTKKKNARSGGV